MDYLSRISGKKVLVTGGLGFVGHNLVKELLKYKCKIVLIDDGTNGKESNLNDYMNEIEFHKFSDIIQSFKQFLYLTHLY